MIYDGTSAHANGESSEDRQIGTSAYNEKYWDNAYVGYMYGQEETNDYNATHANINNSTIKTVVDNWYKTNIEDKGYSDKVADVIYCNDRQIAKNSSSWTNANGTHFGTLGYGKNDTVYAPGSRLFLPDYGWKYLQEIKMTCSQKNDAFTVDDTSKGNGALTYPVGLITVDEVVAAGATQGRDNIDYYLYTGQPYWTLSPNLYSGDFAVVFSFHFGAIGYYYVGNNYYVKPVLSLKPSVELTGTGTMSNPYQVQ